MNHMYSIVDNFLKNNNDTTIVSLANELRDMDACEAYRENDIVVMVTDIEGEEEADDVKLVTFGRGETFLQLSFCKHHNNDVMILESCNTSRYYMMDEEGRYCCMKRTYREGNRLIYDNRPSSLTIIEVDVSRPSFIFNMNGQTTTIYDVERLYNIKNIASWNQYFNYDTSNEVTGRCEVFFYDELEKLEDIFITACERSGNITSSNRITTSDVIEEFMKTLNNNVILHNISIIENEITKSCIIGHHINVEKNHRGYVFSRDAIRVSIYISNKEITVSTKVTKR